MYAKGSLLMKYQENKYPDSKTRLRWIQENTTNENRAIARKGMDFILGQCDLFMFNIYEKRDLAASLIKEGKTEEALAVLDKIGEIE